jgi:Flp pilus assembly protein TadD
MRLRRWRVEVSIGLVLLTLGVYANSLSNPFMFDDRSIIVRDPRIQQGDWLGLLSGRYWNLPSATRHYRPLVSLSYGINWGLSPHPWGFRVLNVLLHAGASTLLFLFALELFGSVWGAAAAGMFFALHPVHTETLNAIVGRADLLVALGLLCAAWIYWRDSAPGASRGLGRPVKAAAVFAAALLCKENAVTLVGVVVLLDWWRQRQGEATGAGWWWRRVLRAYLPMILILAAYLATREVLLDSAPVGKPAELQQIDNPIATPTLGLADGDSALMARWATPLVTFGRAAGLMVWPADLCCDYSYAAIDTVKRFTDQRLPAAFGWIVLVVAGSVISLRRHGKIAFALAFSLITYSIVSNVPLVIGTVFGERLLYLPSVGVCLCAGIMVAGSVGLLRQAGMSRRVVGSCILAALVLDAGWLAHRTVDRNRDWRSDRDLWVAAEQVNPRSCRVLNMRAERAFNDGEDASALDYAHRSMNVSPSYWNARRTAALAYRRQGRLDKAYTYFHRALDLGAGADDATVLGMVDLLGLRGEGESAVRLIESALGERPDWRTGRYRYAALLAEVDRQGEALDILQKLILQHPGWAMPRFKLAELLAKQGAVDDAVAHMEAILKVEPGHRAARIQAAAYLKQMGRYAKAIAYLRILAQEDPDVAALNNLAWWLIIAEPVELRNANEALVYSRLARSMAPGNSAVIDTHVEVLQALGRHEQAAKELRSALGAIAADDPLLPSLLERLKELER